MNKADEAISPLPLVGALVPLSHTALQGFSISQVPRFDFSPSLSISFSLCRSRPLQISGFSLGLSPSLSISIANHRFLSDDLGLSLSISAANHSIFHTWKHCGGALLRKLIQHSQPLKSS
ncbi:uncharacterized protein LOC114319803 isoform X3 [Camellia sinensis]|uniref:uncharacterized protein LOC114319803 isoform X3 n=1 Tax=Camellia sinensis TaxID=4442 RepID=UPI0010360511|nr:uncharacterized protein LOC114319803 isoform X3 [Camellia sinensis]